MGVHVDSVIPVWLQDYDPVFYTALTNQEEWAYLNPAPLTKANWITLFGDIVSAIASWKGANRQSLLQDVMPAIYSYSVMDIVYGTGSGSISSMSASQLFAMGGFIAACKSRPVNYYNDGVIGPPVASAKVTADVSAINGYAAGETSVANSIKNTSQAVISSVTNKLLFEDLPILGSPTKAGQAELVFDTLGYSKVYAHLNVGTLTPPPGY